MRAGHGYGDILHYTLAQVRAFLQAAERTQREDLAGQFALLVTALHGSGHDIESLMHELTP